MLARRTFFAETSPFPAHSATPIVSCSSSSSAVSTYVSREDNTKYAERRSACATLEYWCRSCTADDRPRPIVRCLQVALGWSLWSGDTDSSRKCGHSRARVAAAIASGYEADATSHPPLFKRSVPQALPRACLRERSARSRMSRRRDALRCTYRRVVRVSVCPMSSASSMSVIVPEVSVPNVCRRL